VFVIIFVVCNTQQILKNTIDRRYCGHQDDVDLTAIGCCLHKNSKKYFIDIKQKRVIIY